MRKLISTILILSFFFSCTRNESFKDYDKSASMKEIGVNNEVLSSKRFENIAIQKFQNYNDLQQLKEKNPEMEEDIIIQLQKLSRDEIVSLKNTNISIEDMYQKGAIEIVSEDTKRIKLLYSFMLHDTKVKDSVFVYIKSKAVKIDGLVTTANKIMFAKK